MDVNNQNYEEYILDFLEGNLKPDMHKKVELFLHEHPAIQEEVKDLEKYVLPVEEVNYPNKALLFKPERKPIFNLFTTGIAASLALLLGVVFFMKQSKSTQTVDNKPIIEQQTPRPTLADNTENIEQPESKTIQKKESNENNNTTIKKIPNLQKQQLAQQPSENVAQPNSSQTINRKDQENTNKLIYNQPVLKQQPVENKTVVAAVNEENQQPNTPKQVKSITPQKTLQATLSNEEQKQIKPQVKPKTSQSVIDNITNGIDFAENKDNTKPKTDKTDGFEIESLKSEKDTYITSTLNNDPLHQSSGKTALDQKGESSILGIILKTDKKEIKKAILPKSFGFGEKKEKDIKKIDLKPIEIKPIKENKTDSKKK